MVEIRPGGGGADAGGATAGDGCFDEYGLDGARGGGAAAGQEALESGESSRGMTFAFVSFLAGGGRGAGGL